MSKTFRTLALLVATIAATTGGTAVLTPSAALATTTEPVPAAAEPAPAAPAALTETASLTAEGTTVVTTVEVPATPYPVQVSRQYSYDLFGTCWTTTGRPLPNRQRLIASVGMPQSAGTSQLRRPTDARTSFRFVDAAGQLAHPPSGTRTLTCPRNTVPGAYRARLHGWTVRILHYGVGETVLTGDSDVELHYAAPTTSAPVAR